MSTSAAALTDARKLKQMSITRRRRSGGGGSYAMSHDTSSNLVHTCPSTRIGKGVTEYGI